MRNLTRNTASSHKACDVTALTQRLARLRKLAWWLNSAGRIPGIRTRFGLDTILGIIPGGGDLISTALSLYIVFEGHRLGVSRAVVGRMLLNVGIEAVVGVIPLLGTLFDTVFKADLRNLELMEAALARRGFSDPVRRGEQPR